MLFGYPNPRIGGVFDTVSVNDRKRKSEVMVVG